MKRISILGSTGSIGQNTIEVVSAHPESFEIVALAAGSNVPAMVEQVRRTRPKLISMASKEAAEQVRREVDSSVQVMFGEEGLLAVATCSASNYVVSAIVGSQGLTPTLAAIEAGKTIGLANKETLVMGGAIVTKVAREHGVEILPIDSEHSAIFQCLNGERRSDVKKMILTASGGSFRDWSREDIARATPAEALKHPNWSMGAKVTIDSATMLNKGLEVIEAHWLFKMDYEQIEVLIHPQSIVHSLVEFQDGAMMAQLGTPDMKVPIQYALTYPQRLPLAGEQLDLAKLGSLHFYEPDLTRYPLLKYAFDAGKAGGSVPAVLNAANEVAVERFLQEEIPYLGIEEIVGEVLVKHQKIADPTLQELYEADHWARLSAREIGIFQ
ncbi:1-deoxy-D-xylulose-5-phosphate reductoisomerase [Mechercharimyces sp. CAU 1602]|uniref:1-deoxy-D-xylulose-5-phosphate reductoisomerase n=1 Tax=Mechercharimyces sp. CAU 1602 TaxID=2973933 RepID=UPI0021632BBA|nr:1-deoxy-D-xylulose-5-phosphate reductoisomerase [Mechercharimyces sp. CAU 1602]MCS1351298.1 1-deoxy-D-xylulose-5-phosphate reductoisomerase [Mechercharimyces sp. CAU 1602]